MTSWLTANASEMLSLNKYTGTVVMSKCTARIYALKYAYFFAFCTFLLPISFPINVQAAVAYPSGNCTHVDVRFERIMLAPTSEIVNRDAIIELTSCKIHSRDTSDPMGIA